MKQGKGIGVCAGVAIGKVFIYQTTCENEYIDSQNGEQEVKRFKDACEKSKEQLTALFEQINNSFGQEKAAIIEVQLLMLQDEDFLQGVMGAIQRGKNAVAAVTTTGEEKASFFATLDDSYMKERASDILDVSRRIVDNLLGNQQRQFPEGEFVVIAEDLAPSQTVSFPRERIIAMVTKGGSTSSHTAILARTLNIPSLVQADIPIEEIDSQALFAVDATHNRWYSDPTQQMIELLKEQQEKEDKQTFLLESFRGKKTVTPKGTEIDLFANIGSAMDIPAVLQGDAQGIGLMRTEFLYMGKQTPPTEEEQFKAYSQVAKSMKNKPVILRTLDIGADKQVGFLSFTKEENPALGVRGIRLCLQHPQLFCTQLRAIYRASVYGNLHIMFPMLSTLWGLNKAKELCEGVRNQLATEGYPVKALPMGVMIETPAAALISGVLAKEVDFFSVGTNDLIQYTLAADRQNQSLSEYRDNEHPALWKLLSYVAENAKRAGIGPVFAENWRLSPQRYHGSFKWDIPNYPCLPEKF